MPKGGYFAKMGGLFLLGLVALIIAFIGFTFALPYILTVFIPVGMGIFLIIVVFLITWAAVYGLLVLGAVIYYFFRNPMRIEKKGSYSIDRTKESGKRQKKG